MPGVSEAVSTCWLCQYLTLANL